jgi:hypothetical protein
MYYNHQHQLEGLKLNKLIFFKAINKEVSLGLSNLLYPNKIAFYYHSVNIRPVVEGYLTP